MRFDAVLLDLYDTLAWSDWAMWQRHVADRIGVSYADAGRAFSATRPARNVGAFGDAEGDIAAVVEACGVASTPGLIADLRKMELESLDGTVHLYADSLPVVRQLRERGVAAALVSNCSFNTRPIVDRLALEDEFDAVILSFEVGTLKPEPAIYRAALERLGGADPAACAFVDDQVSYCDGAATVGLETYLILRPEEAAEGRPASTNGHRVIDDLTPLLR